MFAQLREEYTKLHAEVGTVLEAVAKEARELKAEEKEANDKRYARMDQLKGLLDEQAKFAKHALETGAVTLPKEPAGKEAFDRSEGGQQIDAAANIDRAEFSKAFRHWAHTGEMDRKFATITTATASSILLPKTVMQPLITGPMNAFREGYAAWGVQTMQTPGDTSTFNLPVLDPTAGGLVAENASSETENAPSLSESIVSTVKTYQSGSVYYSNLQLAATSFDLLSATTPHLHFNKELGLESAMAAAMVADAGITQAVTSATTTGFTWANLVSLNNALPKRYQQMKVILLSANAYAAAEGLVDEQGRPIMIGDTQTQNLKRIGGSPTFRSDYLETLAAAHVVGLIFSLTGFHLRDAGEGVTRYDQVPAKPNQTGINLFGYHAYGYSVSAVAKLKTAAS